MGDLIYYGFKSKFYVEILCKFQQLPINSDMKTFWPCFYKVYQKRQEKK